MAKEILSLIYEVANQPQAEIKIDAQEISKRIKNINQETIAALINLGWTDDEIKDLLLQVFDSKSPIPVRIGVFGSMSRGKQDENNKDENLARADSDIDIIIETASTINVTNVTSLYSGRKLNIMSAPHNFAPKMFQVGLDNYSEILWVYEDKIGMSVLKFEMKLRGKTDDEIFKDVHGF